MQNAQEYIDDFYRQLKERERVGFKTDLGPKLVKAIEDGSLGPDQLSVALQGSSLSSSDEAIGYLRSIMDSDVPMLTGRRHGVISARLMAMRCIPYGWILTLPST